MSVSAYKQAVDPSSVCGLGFVQENSWTFRFLYFRPKTITFKAQAEVMKFFTEKTPLHFSVRMLKSSVEPPPFISFEFWKKFFA